jgi:uncharacterized membrane-anchored protein YhcB (DUF1043 family)
MAAKDGQEEAVFSEKSKRKNLWWCFAIILLILGMLAGLGIFEYQKFRAKEDSLGQELSKVKDNLTECRAKQTPTCKEEPKKLIKKARKVHRHAAPKPVAKVVVPKVEEKKYQIAAPLKPNATQMAAVCSPLPIISDGQGGWKCAQPIRVEVVKEDAKPQGPDVYYPAVYVGEEESSFPTAQHALGCAGVGALGGYIVEGNGRGALRGAVVAVVGDLVGTAIGGRAGGDIGCGVGTAGNMIYRYRNRSDGNNFSPPIVSQPPTVRTLPPGSGETTPPLGPGVKTFPPSSGY